MLESSSASSNPPFEVNHLTGEIWLASSLQDQGGKTFRYSRCLIVLEISPKSSVSVPVSINLSISLALPLIVQFLMTLLAIP